MKSGCTEKIYLQIAYDHSFYPRTIPDGILNVVQILGRRAELVCSVEDISSLTRSFWLPAPQFLRDHVRLAGIPRGLPRLGYIALLDLVGFRRASSCQPNAQRLT